jgi:prevent-host-death family protein
MKVVPMHQAKTSLSKLVQQACDGDEVIIARGRTPLVKLVPVEQRTPKRKFGALKGKLTVSPRFFEPLPEAELRAWEK